MFSDPFFSGFSELRRLQDLDRSRFSEHENECGIDYRKAAQKADSDPGFPSCLKLASREKTKEKHWMSKLSGVIAIVFVVALVLGWRHGRTPEARSEKLRTVMVQGCTGDLVAKGFPEDKSSETCTCYTETLMAKHDHEQLIAAVGADQPPEWLRQENQVVIRKCLASAGLQFK
jgi:hypothetical protein